MRYLLIIYYFIFLLFFIQPLLVQANDGQEDLTMILEVNEPIEKVVTYIKQHYPNVQLLETYDILLQGVAVRGNAKEIHELQTESFVEMFSENYIYEAIGKKASFSISEKQPNIFVPHMLHHTTYTGKGVKVGVIDTGIDLQHVDLKQAYQGGADMVDFQQEPQETDEGLGQTVHGTHVAGIIAANGKLRGVAPDSEVYAYRALGRGGLGTSVQVIAAMEKAVQEGVHIINLSLGNNANVPDYATSKAVNEAVNQGIIVVVANGNDGPNDWTIGAPATANNALSVGAYAHSIMLPYIVDPFMKEKLPIIPIREEDFWMEEQSHYVTKEIGNSHILYIEDSDKVEEILPKINEMNQRVHAILMDVMVFSSVDEAVLNDLPVPVALVEEKLPNNWFKNKGKYMIQLKLQQTEEGVASFSSRGPVALNWQMKPDIIAPGLNVLSTIPGGYDVLSGTSMAAPHITGAVAIMKEAHPTWSNEQIVGALKTTARTLTKETPPTEQGTGLIQLEEAIQTNIIIEDPMLSFGKMHRFLEERTIPLIIENVGHKTETFHFKIPKKERGMTWKLPQAFQIAPGEKKELPVTLKLNTVKMEDGLHEGFITISTNEKQYDIPYLYVFKQTANKKLEQFTIKMIPTEQNTYAYNFYATEKVDQLDVLLLDVEHMTLEQNVLSIQDVSIGKNVGTIQLDEINLPNQYVFVFIIQLEDGQVVREYVDL